MKLWQTTLLITILMNLAFLAVFVNEKKEISIKSYAKILSWKLEYRELEPQILKCLEDNLLSYSELKDIHRSYIKIKKENQKEIEKKDKKIIINELKENHA